MQSSDIYQPSHNSDFSNSTSQLHDTDIKHQPATTRIPLESMQTPLQTYNKHSQSIYNPPPTTWYDLPHQPQASCSHPCQTPSNQVYPTSPDPPYHMSTSSELQTLDCSSSQAPGFTLEGPSYLPVHAVYVHTSVSSEVHSSSIPTQQKNSAHSDFCLPVQNLCSPQTQLPQFFWLIGQRLWSAIDNLLIEKFKEEIWLHQPEKCRLLWRRLSRLFGDIVEHYAEDSKREQLLDEGLIVVAELSKPFTPVDHHLDECFLELWDAVNSFTEQIGSLKPCIAKVEMTEAVRDNYGKLRFSWFSIVLHMFSVNPSHPELYVIQIVEQSAADSKLHLHCLLQDLCLPNAMTPSSGTVCLQPSIYLVNRRRPELSNGCVDIDAKPLDLILGIIDGFYKRSREVPHHELVSTEHTEINPGDEIKEEIKTEPLELFQSEDVKPSSLVTAGFTENKDTEGATQITYQDTENKHSLQRSLFDTENKHSLQHSLFDTENKHSPQFADQDLENKHSTQLTDHNANNKHCSQLTGEKLGTGFAEANLTNSLPANELSSQGLNLSEIQKEVRVSMR